MKSALPIELTSEQWAVVDRKIAEYVVGDRPEESRNAVARWHALPLFHDWSACMALRPDGGIGWLAYEAPHAFSRVEEEWVRNIGLFQACLRDPELRFLAPARPSNAIACPGCGGSGQCHVPKGVNNVVCSCGGLGWMPRRPGFNGAELVKAIAGASISLAIAGAALLGWMPHLGDRQSPHEGR